MEEEEAVLDVLRSRNMSRYRFDDQPSNSSYVYRFERNLESSFGVKHALGMNSCTSALWSALMHLKLQPGDEVIIPGYLFVATAAAVIFAGGTPVLCEIDESLTLDPCGVESCVNRNTVGIIAVHMLGAPARMDRLCAIADRHGLWLLEDTAQAFGGSFQGRKLGTWGLAGVTSLNVFKILTAGDGGVLITDDSDLYATTFALHDHGSKPLRRGVADAKNALGLNFRMHELTGAVAWVQLRKLPVILSALHHQKALFLEALDGLPGAVRRQINDPRGECATVAAWIFDQEELAIKVANELGIRTIIHSGKHYYGNIAALSQVSSIPGGESLYKKGMLPQTDGILSRSLILSVGVSDSYLGSGFGINPHSSREEIIKVAFTFRLAVERALNQI
ncbi:MAG: aminotransferase class I/II-fold pyridoxal phosphate-dependent enzyme [Desulfarculaceae bacterium]|nr:aminotransferase class I/II-fold pyridoxal phosphate-dependent enzyme [Desulfarculaceae bacterium]